MVGLPFFSCAVALSSFLLAFNQIEAFYCVCRFRVSVWPTNVARNAQNLYVGSLHIYFFLRLSSFNWIFCFPVFHCCCCCSFFAASFFHIYRNRYPIIEWKFCVFFMLFVHTITTHVFLFRKITMFVTLVSWLFNLVSKTNRALADLRSNNSKRAK